MLNYIPKKRLTSKKIGQGYSISSSKAISGPQWPNVFFSWGKKISLWPLIKFCANALQFIASRGCDLHPAYSARNGSERWSSLSNAFLLTFCFVVERISLSFRFSLWKIWYTCMKFSISSPACIQHSVDITSKDDKMWRWYIIKLQRSVLY